MNDHECDFWRTRSGGLECACGKSRRPAAAPEPSEVEQAEIDRFGIFDGPGIGESI